jgi:DNA-binding transcriptional MocR family regulator
VYSGDRPSPLRRWDTTGIVITCGSFSKTLAPACAWAGPSPARWTEPVLRAQEFSPPCRRPRCRTATIAEYLARHDFDRHLRGLRREVAAKRAAHARRHRSALARRHLSRAHRPVVCRR